MLKRLFLNGYKNKQRVFLLMAIAFLFLNLWIEQSLVGTLGIFLWLIGVFQALQQASFLGSTLSRRVLYGGFAISSLFILLLLFFYFTFSLSEITSFIAFFLVTILVGFCPVSEVSQKKPVARPDPITTIFLFSCLILVFFYISARTDEAILSPWNILGPETFVLFFIAVFLLFWISSKRDDDAPLFLGVCFVFICTSVSVIIYQIGFGFDPFLHRAAEEALVRFGSIEPKQILYSGQYVLVSAVHHLTSWNVKNIDIWLLPILASFVIPIATSIGLEDGWGLSKRAAQTWWPLMLVIPFMLITFTVPFTFSYLFFLVGSCVYPIVWNGTRAQIGAFFSALFVSIFFHPLIAFPFFLFVLFEWMSKHTKRFFAFVRVFQFLAVSLSVPLLFYFYQWQDHKAIAFSSLVTHAQTFFNLFRSPYWHPYPFIPWHLELFYDIRYWMPMMIAIMSVFFLLFWSRLRSHRASHVLFSLALIVAVYGTSTLFWFDGVIPHEQAEYALRLLQALFVFLLPAVIVIVSSFAHRRSIQIVFFLLFSFLISLSFYFSYPQYNLKYPFFAPSVSRDDIEAVHWMDEHSAKEPYLILSNQITSAAAIQEFGFAHYLPFEGRRVLWYAIPTGGELYHVFLDTIYQGASRDRFAELAEKTEVKHIYYLVHNYWQWSESFLEGLGESADEKSEIHNMHIYFYRF